MRGRYRNTKLATRYVLTATRSQTMGEPTCG